MLLLTYEAPKHTAFTAQLRIESLVNQIENNVPKHLILDQHAHMCNFQHWLSHPNNHNWFTRNVS
jgi:hypothetical protein